jgi:hypothetical protein
MVAKISRCRRRMASARLSGYGGAVRVRFGRSDQMDHCNLASSVNSHAGKVTRYIHSRASDGLLVRPLLDALLSLTSALVALPVWPGKMSDGNSKNQPFGFGVRIGSSSQIIIRRWIHLTRIYVQASYSYLKLSLYLYLLASGS